LFGQQPVNKIASTCNHCPWGGDGRRRHQRRARAGHRIKNRVCL